MRITRGHLQHLLSLGSEISAVAVRDFGRNRSTSEQVCTKKLMTSDKVMRFGVGEFLYINLSYNQWPIHYDQIPIPKSDIRLKKECEGMWETIRDRMIRLEYNRRLDLDMEE